jgi:flagella basal body P-ring formation protein FlgA
MTLPFIIVIALLGGGFGGGAIGLTLAADAPQGVQAAVPDRQDTSDRATKPARVRGRQVIYPEQIRKAIQSHLRRQFAGRVQEVHVTLGEPQQPVAVPAGALALTVGSMDGDDGVGRRVFQVHVAINGAFLRTIEATTDVTAYVDILTPVRLIKADEEIDAADVVATRLALSDLKSPYATDPHEVIGKAASRPLPPQVPIKLTSLRRPFVVRKGDRVMIEAKMGGLSIQTAGVTKGNGELGQTVTVSNTDSGKEVRAKVVGPGVVRVDF